MSLVDQQTGEVVEQCDEQRARDLTEKIRTTLGVQWELIKDAYRERAWAALGYSSWDEYAGGEFPDHQIRLPREERREVVGSLREAGLSIRAIAATGVASKQTVERDLAAGVMNEDTSQDAPVNREASLVYPTDPPKVTGTDGKQYQASRPAPPEPSSPPKPQRRPLPQSIREAGIELTKAAEKVERLVADDRFQANKEQVTPQLRGHLRNTVEVCQDLLDQITDQG